MQRYCAVPASSLSKLGTHKNLSKFTKGAGSKSDLDYIPSHVYN
jgi:hypothetical protein